MLLSKIWLTGNSEMLFSKNFFLIQDFYGSHGPWAFKLVLSDFLNLVNLILNILFLHWYLRGHFVDYGVEFVSYQLEETKFRKVHGRLTKPTLT